MFSVGMVHVALPCVKMLAEIHLVAFNAKFLMVGESFLNEVNRLKQTHQSDLPLQSSG